MNTVWIGLGGALGSIARYHLGLLAAERWGVAFPWGTLLINAIGSLCLGALMCVALTTGRIPEPVRLGVAVGVFGGFTTYSTFNHETFAMALAGDWGKAIANVAATLLACLAAGALGWFGARAIVGT
jgi:CrcB protein